MTVPQMWRRARRVGLGGEIGQLGKLYRGGDRQAERRTQTRSRWRVSASEWVGEKLCWAVGIQQQARTEASDAAGQKRRSRACVPITGEEA